MNYTEGKIQRLLANMEFTDQELFGPPTDRPSSASYTPRYCRAAPPGSGGTPCPNAHPPTRPVSVPLGGSRGGGRRPKTERWREAGRLRWPPPAPKPQEMPLDEPLPVRYKASNPQFDWGSELWCRSLRHAGVYLQDPLYSELGAHLPKELHEEWCDRPPQVMSARQVPYSGATASGAAALPNKKDSKRWMDKPVSTGKYALDHMSGVRYEWDKTPRRLDEETERAHRQGRRPWSASAARNRGGY